MNPQKLGAGRNHAGLESGSQEEFGVGYGADYDSVGERDGEFYGILIFAVWSEIDLCKGFDRYIVSW